MRQKIVEAIKSAFKKLKDADGCLFECPIGEANECDPRKLHEVCVNHKLANYLEETIFPILKNIDECFFVDIEFNREGVKPKRLEGDLVRPDMIIHNRKSGDGKNNFLVVECKKHDRSQNEIDEDVNNLKKFMRDDKYKYQYGLQVIYFSGKIEGTFFYFDSEQIENEGIVID